MQSAHAADSAPVASGASARRTAAQRQQQQHRSADRHDDSSMNFVDVDSDGWEAEEPVPRPPVRQQQQPQPPPPTAARPATAAVQAADLLVERFDGMVHTLLHVIDMRTLHMHSRWQADISPHLHKLALLPVPF